MLGCLWSSSSFSHKRPCLLPIELTVAFSIFCLAFAISLEGQTTAALQPYATSAFLQHALVAAVLVVQQVVNGKQIWLNQSFMVIADGHIAVVKPPMAKIANVFGRLEAYSFSIYLYLLGYIQMTSSRNVETFASAQIFYSAGFTGQLILQQIFIADTTDLRWRALLSSLPDVPFLVTVWCGPPLAQHLLTYSTWRWGYGLWAIVLPAAFMPLAISLAINLRKAHQRGIVPPRPWQDVGVLAGLKNVWFELDVMGLLLLAAAISLIVLPLTLAATASGGWQNGSIIAMIVVGCVCLVAFPCWESIPKLAPYPFLSVNMLMNRNVVVGCIMGFFYFGKQMRTKLIRKMLANRHIGVFYTSIYPYFSSYLQVVHNLSITSAGYITNTFSFASTASSVVVGIIIKYTKHYKYYMCAGAAVYLLGIGIMMRYRVEGSTVGQIVGTQIVIGIGGGFFNVPTQLGVQASVPHQDVAAATALFLTVIEIGGAVGAGISGAVWTSNISSKLSLYLPPESQSQAPLIAGSLVTAQAYLAGTPERAAINQAYQETMNILLIIALCFAAPIVPLTWVMKNYRLDQVSRKRVSLRSNAKTL